MPRLSYFYGIAISMYGNEGTHQIAHIHARYAEHRASIAFDGTVLAGSLPSAKLSLVRAWLELHPQELAANWQRGREGQRLEAIDPLA